VAEDERPPCCTERLIKADERRRVVLVEVKNASARDEKKARRRVDAPSNKTLWQLLLGFHSSHSLPAGSRTNTRFFVVAGYQQGNPSTAYPQSGVDGLGTVSAGSTPCQNKMKLSVARLHYRYAELQSPRQEVESEEALTPKEPSLSSMTFQGVERPSGAINEPRSAG
jgi:Holliday junction resolvase-like predicted endonuclease